jgi:hypothetical protein
MSGTYFLRVNTRKSHLADVRVSTRPRPRRRPRRSRRRRVAQGAQVLGERTRRSVPRRRKIRGHAAATHRSRRPRTSTCRRRASNCLPSIR